jgi:hypothetical protein
MQKIKYHLPKKISANKIYAGGHWIARKKDKDLFRSVLFVANKVDKYPVKCHYHFEFSKKRLDISNCFYMVKLIEDCLVKKGILINDDPKFINEIKVTQSLGDNICNITIEYNG